MPIRKHWRKSDSKRRERSRIDESETAVRSVGSPSNVVAAGSPSNVVATGSPSNVVAPVSPSNVVAAGSPSNVVATRSPSNVVALSPSGVMAASPSSVGASHMANHSTNHSISQETQRNYQANPGSPSNVVASHMANRPSNVVASHMANHSTNHSSNHSISQATQRNYQANFNQFKQAIIDFKSIIASNSSNTQTDFDIVFLDTFPDVAANYQSKDNKELSERESIAVCPVNTSQQNEEHDRNVTAEHHLSDPLEICSDNDVACYIKII